VSRGHGHVQRAILGYLATDPSGRYKSGAPRDTRLYQLTCGVFGVSRPTDSQRASVRRAVRQLHRAGLIKMQERVPVWGKDHPAWRGYWRRSRYPLPGRELEEVAISEMHVSRLLTPEEAVAEKARFRKLGLV
jgi:hypothetical protein